jgi:hypothetical protein
MGGQSTTTQTQQSQTTPWVAAQPTLQTILGQIGSGLNNTGLTPSESSALDTLRTNAGQGNPYAGQIAGYAQSLLNGGGATAQTGNVQDNLATYRSWLTPYANGSMIGNNPALTAQLAQMQSDVGNSVNSQFAAAGRDFSGANQMAYGRGVAAAEAPVIAAQYNQDVANQLAAANALYGAGNTTANTLTQMQQSDLANRGQSNFCEQFHQGRLSSLRPRNAMGMGQYALLAEAAKEAALTSPAAIRTRCCSRHRFT